MLRITTNIIISPSGSFYGSERVLFDYLSKTNNNYIVFVPSDTIFKEKLLKLSKKTSRHIKIKSFRNVYLLYILIAFQLFNKKINKVYANEGGHIKYLNLLAKLFPKKLFFSHVRLLDDTNEERYDKARINLTLISVSDYITQNIISTFKSNTYTLYDPYNFTNSNHVIPLENKKMSLGIIGRIAPIKGLASIILFLNNLDENIKSCVVFNFIGSPTSHPEVEPFLKQVNDIKNINVKFWNHVDSIQDIFNNTDIVLHFSQEESVGRIFFEAIDYQKPFIGFNSGGIGEIAKNIHYKNIVEYDTQGNWIEEMNNRLQDIIDNYYTYQGEMIVYKKNAKEIYNLDIYTQQLDKLLE